jgi:uncharacterized membrane protein
MNSSRNLSYYVKVFFCTLIIMAAFDFLWLGLVANKLYSSELGSLVSAAGGNMAFRWPAAAIVYLLLPLGLVLFILPRLASGLRAWSLLWGAMFGLVVYGVYDLTNLALLPQWTLKVTIIDILWGMFLYAIVSFIIGYIEKFFR